MSPLEVVIVYVISAKCYIRGPYIRGPLLYESSMVVDYRRNANVNGV